MGFDGNNTYYRKARNGEAFIVSETFNITSGSTANINLRNPSDSGRRFWVMEVSVSSDGPYTADISETFTSEPSGGTEIEIENVLLDDAGGDDDGVAMAYENVSYAASSSHAVGVGGGGTGGTSSGYFLQHPPVVIESSREIVLNVENTGTESNNYALTVVYFETTMS